MADQQFEDPQARPFISSDDIGWRSSRRPLPPDLLREATRRVRVISLTGAVLWVTASIADHLAMRAMGHVDRWMRIELGDIISIIAAVVSTGLYLYTKRSDRRPESILNIGLGYLVFTCFALGITIHSNVVPRHATVFPMLTWVGVVLIMFAAMVPNTPRKTLIVGVLAATMNPVAMLVARSLGVLEFDHTSDVLLMHYPDFFLVGVSVVISHVVTRLGHQVAKARELGSYKLGDLLGRGGMGEVYRASHRLFARPAAIKLIRPDMVAGPDGKTNQLAVTRFRREAEAAANLRSPHTVELYDFGVTEDQTLYFVMELLDGLDLETMVKRYGPLPESRVIHILLQVCDSLDEAHRRGLVHRDIKPANIHLGRVGLRTDFVKVLDFGLVKSFDGGASDMSMGTAAGLTPGTPSYMAPEMALGEEVDGRADIYALGCVAYYLVTGKQVFEASSGVQMIARHVRAEPVPPTERAPIALSKDFERLILHCLAKKPAERPASARDIAQRLSQIDITPWTEQQADEWWAAQRPAVASEPSAATV